jgi:hypothetical protein
MLLNEVLDSLLMRARVLGGYKKSSTPELVEGADLGELFNLERDSVKIRDIGSMRVSHQGGTARAGAP